MATTAKNDAVTAKDAAAGSATSANQSASAAASSATGAAGSASTASTQAGLATTAKDAASTSATTAQQSASAAAASASSASGSASTASTQAGIATSAKDTASGHATSAGVYSGQAAASATSAAGSATSAASALQQVQASNATATAAVQTLATTVAGPNGATAQYTVKTDANGYVAGFGLSNTSNTAGGATSEFIIVADKFSIAPVNTSNTDNDGSPFFHRTTSTIINGETIPAGTYMKDAYIHNASVNTLKIAGNAVTVPVSAFTAGTFTNTQTNLWQSAQSISLTTSGSRVYITTAGQAVQAAFGESESVAPLFRLTRNGVELMASGSQPSMSFSETPAAGTYTYALEVRTPFNGNIAVDGGGVSNRSIFVIETKR